jgi:hypothetical protein
MRLQFYILVISVIVLNISCLKKSTPTQPSYKYEKMLFLRQGGGNKSFYVIPTKSTDVFQINLIQIDFRDTTITMTLSKDGATASTFDSLTKTLYGMHELTGNFKPSTLPTGTWAHVYMVKGEDKIEVTNHELRKTLMSFENIVLNNLK